MHSRSAYFRLAGLMAMLVAVGGWTAAWAQGGIDARRDWRRDPAPRERVTLELSNMTQTGGPGGTIRGEWRATGDLGAERLAIDVTLPADEHGKLTVGVPADDFRDLPLTGGLSGRSSQMLPGGQVIFRDLNGAPAENFHVLSPGAGRPGSFSLRRPAGRMVFDVDADRQSGRLTFSPDPRFIDAVEQIERTTPSPLQLIRLAVLDIDPDYLDVVRRATRPAADLEGAILLKANEVAAAYVAGLFDAGRVLSIAQIIDLRHNGPTARGAQAVTVSARFTANEMILMHNAGVPAGFIDAARGMAPGFSANEITMMYNAGVTDRYLDAARVGLEPAFSAIELVRLHNAGVSADFLRQARLLGGFSPNEIIRLNNSGVSAEYLAACNAGGTRFSANEITRMRAAGVPADYLAGVLRMGQDYSANEIIRMHNSGVPVPAPRPAIVVPGRGR